MFKCLGICGSFRKDGNTGFLLKYCLNKLSEMGVETELIWLCDYDIKPCTGCRNCLKTGACAIKDDMTNIIIPKLLEADIIVLASPVYFNNVTSIMKTFMDRTWCIRGKLRNKIGGAIVVGRGYGLDNAITQIHLYMLKHEMIIGHRGVIGRAYEKGEIKKDKEAIKMCRKLAKRLHELAKLTHKNHV